ncbi:fatty acyl-AMP ligase [Parafrankia sp. FMc2]|uniref:fatty acyl-AMP ligase n=1 Tax=Parafrankia sp. FMc2 TaxID=3233196 RepID=UPI0034D795B0
MNISTTDDDSGDLPAVPARAGTLADHLAHWAEHAPDEPAMTFVDYERDRDGAQTTLTYRELRERVRAVAVGLGRIVQPGDRVALLTPQNLDYVVAFLGALAAGAVAVPLFPPGYGVSSGRLAAVLADCDPRCVMTSASLLDQVEPFTKEWLAGGPATGEVTVAAVDQLVDETFDDLAWATRPPSAVEDVAYLQYTSGSTRVPAGVVITHRNVVVNAYQALAGHQVRNRGDHTTVSWLPLFHDMGLILSIAGPIAAGVHSVILDPLAFVQRPSRWLRQVSRYPGVVTAAPNFAYDYCVKRVKAADKAELRLDRVRSFANGAEPVRAGTLRRFYAAFAECGLRETALRPTYGLAEATVLVCVSPMDEGPTTVFADSDVLALGHLEPPAGPAAKRTELVSSGAPVDQELRIVDPVTCQAVPDGTVGEIWIRGDNVGRGYWRQEQTSAEVFRAVLRTAATGARAETPGTGSWLRTGDLASWYEGGLFVTGRIKDMIIVDGRNVYPQDVESTVEEAHPAVGRHRTAAFTVPTAGGGGGGEGVVVVAERYHAADGAADETGAVARAVRAAVSSEHNVSLHDFLLVEPGSVPRTSSGKIARRACRQAYLDGRWDIRSGSIGRDL